MAKCTLEDVIEPQFHIQLVRVSFNENLFGERFLLILLYDLTTN